MAQVEKILVPDIGDFSDVEIIEILVSPGDTVKAEDSLITLESDKASMEIPAPKGGTVKELLVKVGDRISEGSPILTLEVGDSSTAGAPSAARETAKPAESTPPPPAAQAPSGGDQIVTVPDIGDFSDVEVIEILVQPGDDVKPEQSLITLESDKASMEIPSPGAGRVKSLNIKLGDRVSEGAPILVLAGAAGGAPAKSEPQAAASAPPASPPRGATMPEEPVAPTRREPPLPPVDDKKFNKAHASPGVRRFARELGADVSRIKGSGPKGRILKDDVKSWVKQALSGGGVAAAPAAAGGAGIPPIPAVDFSQFGEIEPKDLPRIKRISGPHLHRAWLNLPMVTHHDEADITDLEAFRQSLKKEAEAKGVRVTALVFVMKALTHALRAFPNFNASLSPDGQQLIYKKYFHIGIAVDTPNGLVVPVVRDVDRKSIFDLSAEIGDISLAARNGKLSPAQMQGGCMSISSLGGIGGTAFTPIVNAPEVAILGLTRARMQPVWNGKDFTPRLMQPLDLTYDHRVIDGADAARFCVHLGQSLGDLRRLLL